ncbi:hypothetical protein ACFIQG_18275 [Comamonas odontotermitis]|uniref:hypothetical protein n=1 Tax=Comamonas odontotermitis TaxID=379895 RepID=UPI00366A7D15
MPFKDRVLGIQQLISGLDMDDCEKEWDDIKAFFRKHAYGLGAVFAVTVLAGAWYFWGVRGAEYFAETLCPHNSGCERIKNLGAVGDIFGGINAFFAAFALGAVALSTDQARKAYIKEREWIRDEKYLEQIVTSYEWAYSALMDGKKEGPPTADRMNWSNCARHLLRAEKLFGSVATPELQTVLKEQREFWRHQFYLALNFGVLEHAHYFSNIYKNNVEPLYAASALVVVNFSIWKDENDPLDEIDKDALAKELKKSVGISKAGLFKFMDDLKAASSEETDN